MLPTKNCVTKLDALNLHVIGQGVREFQVVYYEPEVTSSGVLPNGKANSHRAVVAKAKRSMVLNLSQITRTSMPPCNYFSLPKKYTNAHNCSCEDGVTSNLKHDGFST